MGCREAGGVMPPACRPRSGVGRVQLHAEPVAAGVGSRDRIADQLLTPSRVADMLRGLMERRTKRDSDYADRLTGLRGKLSEVETRLSRLYQAIENGVADPTDPMLKDRVVAVKTERDIAKAAFDRAVSEMSPEARITEDKIAAFVETMRGNVLSGDTPFRRAWLRSVIDGVEVDETEITEGGRFWSVW
jgi:site-specific DNA recombinase